MSNLVISMHFIVFSQGQGTEFGIFFWVAKISNGPEPTYDEKMRVPPPPLGVRPPDKSAHLSYYLIYQPKHMS